MTIASADVHKAIDATWDDENLDNGFTQFWTNDQESDFHVLNDQEAAPRQPFPYCVFEQEPGDTTDRMTGHSSGELHEIRDIPFTFRVHAKDEGTKAAKQVAADRAEEIIEKFGGHPTKSPVTPTLDNGTLLILQYQNDWGVRTGDNEYQWNISYLVRVDVPVAT